MDKDVPVEVPSLAIQQSNYPRHHVSFCLRPPEPDKDATVVAMMTRVNQITECEMTVVRVRGTASGYIFDHRGTPVTQPLALNAEFLNAIQDLESPAEDDARFPVRWWR